jgi:murein DD-endopeptidase MepM/ murein hydrolase activator NlpD
MKTGWPLAAGGVLLALVVIALIWFAAVRLEGEPPAVTMDGAAPRHIGKSTEIALTLSDPGSGLRRMSAHLTKDSKEFVLAQKEYGAGGFFGLEPARSDTLRIKIDPAALGLTDGKAVLRVRAGDQSWRNWWHGNSVESLQDVFIDTKPPAIEVLSKEHNLNQGGTGFVIYRLNEECRESGVRVGAGFFPGASGHYAEKAIHIAFFALSHLHGPGTEVVIEASDQAGNATRSRFYHHIKKKVFKKDTLTVTDAFIRQILPEFQSVLPPKPNAALKDQFLSINRDLRRMNYENLVGLTRKRHPAMLWQGAFLRLPNAAPRAGFADHRSYIYEGREIDQQDHMGVDLASLAHSPVPAANSGIVLFADGLGIYGQTVVLDHGVGLFSMYSHLSQIAVKPGERMEKGQVLGQTGSTGLAGGDHLHFSMIVHDTFVDPIEWWDPAWIKNTITAKLEAVKSGS